MSKKLLVILAIILVASLGLVACERPASVAPVATATNEGEIPFPVATQPQIMQDILSQTQTAIALTPQAGGGVLPTSTPAFTFTTPQATAATEVFTPTATKIVYATATPGKPATYAIQSGEFPYCIARRFNVDPAALLSASGLNINSRPAVGYTLTIPQSGSFPGERALKTHPATYTVATGDTIGEIACYFGDVNPYDIYAANGLEQGSALKVGQVLQIP